MIITETLLLWFHTAHHKYILLYIATVSLIIFDTINFLLLVAFLRRNKTYSELRNDSKLNFVTASHISHPTSCSSSPLSKLLIDKR